MRSGPGIVRMTTRKLLIGPAASDLDSIAETVELEVNGREGGSVNHSLNGTEVRVPTDDSRWPLASISAPSCKRRPVDLDAPKEHQRCGSLTFGTLDGQASDSPTSKGPQPGRGCLCSLLSLCTIATPLQGMLRAKHIFRPGEAASRSSRHGLTQACPGTAVGGSLIFAAFESGYIVHQRDSIREIDLELQYLRTHTSIPAARNFAESLAYRTLICIHHAGVAV